MNHTIYASIPSLPLPQKGQIVKLCNDYYILASIDYQSYVLVGLLDGNRWSYPTNFLTWEKLTEDQSDEIVCIWPNIKLFLKDVNL